MYYGLIILAVVMFGGTFAMQDWNRKLRGNSLRISLETSLVGSIAGLTVLLLLNGDALDFTVFTVIIAILSAMNSIVFTFCSFQSLSHINLSLFSLFSMLGGMVLPFVQGILFYREPLTITKIVCLGLIVLALMLTVTGEKKRRGTLYYVGIFVLNGMSGVLSKIYTSSSYAKTNAESFSIWIAICTVILSGAMLLLVVRKPAERQTYTVKALALSAGNGSVNQIANYFLVIALAHVDASVQYPMVTRGVMIVSTIICFFGKQKPGAKDILSVILAFIGMLVRFLF